MTEWLCRRHLDRQNISSRQMTKKHIYSYCHKELAFLESLAFNAMERNNIILRPKLLQRASKESECSLQHQPHLLNIGILKSIDYKPIGTLIEADKNHYFVHLSFQENFAARYLVKALNDSADQKKKAIDFIKKHKYNQRFELVLGFASGLLSDSEAQQSINAFWDTLLGEPLDLIGFRHLQVLMACIEETDCNEHLPHFQDSIKSIIKWIEYSVSSKQHYLDSYVAISLERSPSIVNQPKIIDTFVLLHQNKDSRIKENVSRLISTLLSSRPSINLVHLQLTALHHDDNAVRRRACEDLGGLSETAVTNQVINGLIGTLSDPHEDVRWSAYKALMKIAEKAATNEMINRLNIALGDRHDFVRSTACHAFRVIGEKAATREVINKLTVALDDTNNEVRRSACEALLAMGEKAETDKVINRLVIALSDISTVVRRNACEVLGAMGAKAVTNEVINKLVIALDDTNNAIRANACGALRALGKKAATNEVINRLVIALGDSDDFVKLSAGAALHAMDEKAAINEVLNRLVIAPGVICNDVRWKACEALYALGEKAATNEVINGLLITLGDIDSGVRQNACKALHAFGEKAAAREVINKLTVAIGDTDIGVRRSACEALGKVGEKAATRELINKLTVAIGETDIGVRYSACEALGAMGEKAATYEVINGLLIAIGDTHDEVRWSACEALGAMGEKVANNEVIGKLLDAYCNKDSRVRCVAENSIEKILVLPSCISSLKYDTVEKLLRYSGEFDCGLPGTIFPDKLIKALFDTEIPLWIPIIKKVFIWRLYRITIYEGRIAVYAGKESVEVCFSNKEVVEQLRNCFLNWMDESL